MSALALAVAVMATVLVPLLLRDTKRAEQRARMRELTSPMRQAFEELAHTIGISLTPVMRRMTAAIADMAAAMQRADVVFTAAGQRLADEAERYANEADQP